MLKQTPLYQDIVKNGAKIVDFHGWALPLDYGSMLRETQTTRTQASLCDVSHMGQIRIEGADALGLLQSLSTNDISAMKGGDAQYNVFTTERGTIIDDFLVYRTKDSFLCVVNASNKKKDLDWLRANTAGSTEIIDESDEATLLSLQGPASAKIMEAVAGGEVLSLTYMHFGTFMIAGFPCMISRTGYTGEDGFEIYTEAKYVSLLWDIIVAKGAQWVHVMIVVVFRVFVSERFFHVQLDNV